MSRADGFTLMEMLAVVAIIVTLVVLLFGNMKSMLMSSQKSNSISNVRQITLAMNTYASENNGSYPYCYYFKGGANYEEWSYVDKLLPYMTDSVDGRNHRKSIFISPATMKSLKPDYQSFLPYTYAVHGVLSPDADPGADRNPRNIPYPRHAVVRPSQVILVGDSAQKKTDFLTKACYNQPENFINKELPADLNTKIPTGGDVDTGNGGAIRYRYNGFATVGMVDGHVEMMKKGTITYANIVVDR